MLSLNERPTLKARVECANRELESEQNNNVPQKKCEEKEEDRRRGRPHERWFASLGPLSCSSILGSQMWSLSLSCTIMGSDGC